jgi:hypothetical protein
MKVWQLPGTTYDPSAQDYILRVETADTSAGQPGGLEEVAKKAVNNLFINLKSDVILNSLTSACILGLAQTRLGSLVPLVSTMSTPTPLGTESGWSYNRRTGTKGNGTNNYISSSRSNSAEPRNNKSIGVYVTEAQTRTVTRGVIGSPTTIGGSQLITTTTQRAIRINPVDTTPATLGGSEILYNDATNPTGLWAASRSNSTQVNVFINNTSTIYNQISREPLDEIIDVFRRGVNYSDARLLFYYIGTSLNPALLNSSLAAFQSEISNL